MPSHRSVFFTILVIQILLCAVSIAKYVHIVPQNSLTPRSGGLVERYGYRGINLYPVTSTEATGAISSASTTSTSTPTPPTPAKFVKESAIEGRGKHHYKFGKKKKKALKHLYPLIVGLITAKSIIIPLIFKSIILLSKSAFVLSSLSFLVSIVLGIKVLVLHSLHSKAGSESTKVEVVHVPLQQKYGHYSGWIDREMENKYIPISSTYDSYYSDNDKASSASYGY
ncbi:uncharacterized protein LOC129798991 isoform X2 [Phlebotomus papatasi]|uniref:uncharacterized protein LOC129798991 isoform X2 n=1 Tax=Phlebotomus papatasi TaxID=29031 RepID=UPI0024843E58|nr:uncharacterized protein LOC129798991 isoform X2 [Phlebotomus papatasi]